MSKRAFESDVGAPEKKRGRGDQLLPAQKGVTSFAHRTLSRLLEFVQRPLPVQSDTNSIVKSGLFGQPTEILRMIIGNLTPEEIFTFSLTSKADKRVVDGFYANLKYKWIDELFERLKTNQERVRNCHYLLMAVHPNAKEDKKCNYTAVINWVDNIYHKCQHFPVPLFFEALIKSMGGHKASKIIGPLIKRWMGKDVNRYLASFPVGAESPQEIKDVESHLLTSFRRILSDSIQLHTKVYLFTLLMRSLGNISDAYKLLYLFCVPRTDGSIDFEYFGMTHPDGTELNFGKLPAAFALLMNSWKFPVINQFKSRDVFIILEDLTTLPVVWSMHNFVHFLLLNLDLCVLSTCIRFGEGYHDDTAGTFYYCVRVCLSADVLRPLTTQIMRHLPRPSAEKFASEVIRKSQQVINATDPMNHPRLTMLDKAHVRIVDCMEIGLKKSRKFHRAQF